MRGNATRGATRHKSVLFSLFCGLLLAVGCSKAPQQQAEGVLDTSHLPRVAGAKEILASAPSTIFTTPNSVAQTADSLEKALVAEGWQKYVAPNTSLLVNDNQRTLSLKKGPLALGVFITVAPAQGNATSVQYSVVPLKNDVPFPQDASNIEFDPNKPLLALISAEPVDKTLDFYRKELSPLGWSLWSQKLNGVQPAGGASGELTKSGAYAYYLQGDRRLAALVLERTDAGRIKVKFEELPAGYLETLQKEFFNSDNVGAALIDISRLPRLEGAKDDTARSSSDSLVYSVSGSLANTIAATKKMLAADGWKQYVAPLESESTSLFFKKGPQALSVSFTIQVGKNEQTSEVTTLWYSPTRLRFALAIPSDATAVVFDENRPYLSYVTTGEIAATQEFYKKELAALGWSPLSPSDAVKQWPNAKLDEKPANGVADYYIRGTQRPIVLSLQHRDDNNTSVEIKVPPFAEPQVLEAGKEIYGLPVPKVFKTAGGNNPSETLREVYANVPAEVGTVLAFYRRELTARNWKEETQGAVLNPDKVALNFTTPEGSALLKLDHKYDLTIVSLVLRSPKPAAKAEPATPGVAQGDSINALLKEAQQMMREAAVDAKTQTAPPPPKASGPALRVLAENKAPVPVPDSAEDVEFDGGDGTLEFTSTSSFQSVADFYRSTMKEQGWQSGSSVINNPNMVVLNFTKAGKSVSFTIVRMGNNTNVSAEGSALKLATAKAAKAPVQASAEDLEAEESEGLPMPKRHTMSEGTKTPFRRELKASVPLELTDVLGFYRRELGKLNWKEEAKGAKVSDDSAMIAFTAPEGPAMLKLGRKDGETSVSLTVKDPGAAAKGGVMPKPGQAKVFFGNINEAAATITFNNKPINVSAGVGVKNPDGPSLDLPPGKYKYSIKLPGKPAQSDEVEVGADETWGLMIGPGGVLALQAY